MNIKTLVSHGLPFAVAGVLFALTLAHGQTSIDYTDPLPPPAKSSDIPELQPRVFGDFAKINLTQAQREAIHKIQREAKEQIAKIEDEADAKSRLILTPEQTKQLTDIDNERKIKAKKAYETRKQKERADLEELTKRRKQEKDGAQTSIN